MALTTFSILLFLLASSATGYKKHLLYDHGYNFDQQLPKEDEVSSPEIRLAIPIIFFNEKYEAIFVNSNGLLSFQTEIPTFFNIQFPLDYPIIAPLYTNVDIRPSGTISYRETQESQILARATRNIRDHFSNAKDFQARSVFITTWSDVGYHDNGGDKSNTFQAIVISDGADSYVEFIYPEDGIQWIQGTGGESGLPDARAQAGIVSADRVMHILPGSGTDKVPNIMRRSNMNNPGQWLFHVGKVETVGQPDLNVESNSNQQLNVQTCVDASSQCHSKAKCVDYDSGFCCVCQDGFYGNGKSCLKNDVPLRVNGKVSGQLNEVKLDQLDLQSYIVMADGRAYTAISRVPREIGYSVQTLQILGGVIGFLFAKPIGDVKNGYQLTGGIFNHTATINFNTGEIVKITNIYSGLDVFDQLRLEVDIQGNAPSLSKDIKLSLSDYEEQYTITRSGVILSQTQRAFKNSETGQDYQFTIEQSIKYTPCKFDALPANPTWKLKVTKNFIGYENKEQIIRFGMTNKVAPLGEIDPCKEGRKHCGVDTSCIVEGDSYRCVCNPGYQYIYNEENQGICVDINECQVGHHNCDVNAVCYNQPGGFTCSCKSGYEGDGEYCRNVQTCADIQCGANAECVEDQEAKCECLRGYIGDGRICVADKRIVCDIVNNCSPNGACGINEATNQYECSCFPEYEGNGYQCEPARERPTTISTTDVTEPELEDRVVERCIYLVCWCPDGYDKDIGTSYCIRRPAPTTTTTETPSSEVIPRPVPQCLDNDTCVCPWGYKYTHNICSPIPGVQQETMGPTGQNLSCNIINNCHPRAQCLFVSNMGNYQCQCEPLFNGDGSSCSLNEGVNCAEHNVCDENASCFFHEEGKYYCQCHYGYKGDGIVCEESDCTIDDICKDTEECAYSPDDRKNICVCLTGYARVDGECQQLQETWCGGGKCVKNAQCLYDEQQEVNYCQCDAGYYGDGITECLPKPIGCEVLNNCGLNANCMYNPETELYQCLCNDKYYGDGFVCSSQRTCQVDPYMCDQHAKCVENSDRQHVCKCEEGYSGNGSVCKLNQKHAGNFLLLNQGMATLKVPFNPTPKNPGTPIQIQYYQMAIGLDIDCVEGRVYWSDITGKAIKSSDYNGTSYIDFLLNDIGSPEGLGIDWASRNIYWTDSTKKTIEVANIDTKLRKTLFSDNLVNPRGIAVHPQKGKVFWSDWNRKAPKIEWANMDGSDRQIFLQGASVQLPNSLAIDWATNDLCYADAGTKTIECVNIDTKQLHTIAVNCTYPFGLAISEDHFYWTDWVSLKIESVFKTTLVRQQPMKVPLGGSGKLYGMAAVPDHCRDVSNGCQFNNGHCSPGHLCLPNGVGGRTCVCAAKDLCNDLE